MNKNLFNKIYAYAVHEQSRISPIDAEYCDFFNEDLRVAKHEAYPYFDSRKSALKDEKGYTLQLIFVEFDAHQRITKKQIALALEKGILPTLKMIEYDIDGVSDEDYEEGRAFEAQIFQEMQPLFDLIDAEKLRNTNK